MKKPEFTAQDNETWKRLYSAQRDNVFERIHPLFSQGLDLLEIPADRVPDLDIVNKKLQALTGFKGVYVTGFEGPLSFFPMLARREFPIGAFIRSSDDLSYTPAPDVFHDLYGHLPWLANHEYADFSQKFGEVASRYLDKPGKLKQFDRYYWFTVEFSLIRTPSGNRVFGAGISSSSGETKYALSSTPEVRPFNLEEIRNQDFKIDEFQKKLFLLSSTDQLYSSLVEFEQGLACCNCGKKECGKT